MGKRRKKKKRARECNYQQKKQDTIDNIEAIEIESLTQAIIRAHHIIEENKKVEECQRKESEERNNKRPLYIIVLIILNVLFFPWKINKKLSINNQIYDSVLVIFVSSVLVTVGAMSWLMGILMIIDNIVDSYTGKVWEFSVKTILLEFFLLMLGGLLITSGNEFSKVSDSNKIYAYSASIIALIGVVLTVVSMY